METGERKFSVEKDVFFTFAGLKECLEEAFVLLVSDEIKAKCGSEYWVHYEVWKMIGKVFEPVVRTLNERFAQWRFLEEQEEGYICKHIIATMCVLYKDVEYLDLSCNDQNALMWTMMLHDIYKRGVPLVKSRDPFHPFLSAAKALEIFTEFNLIPLRPGLKDFCEYIMSAYVKDENDTEIMDYSKIEEIFRGLLYFTWITPSRSHGFSSYSELEVLLSEEQRFYFEILVLILVHQSVDLNPIFPLRTCLSGPQIRRFLSRRMLKMMFIVHKADHNSYNIGRFVFNDWPNDRVIYDQYLSLLALF